MILETSLTLDKAGQNLTASLQKRMSHHNLQEPLQTFPPMLNHIVAKAVREHLAWQRWDRDPRALALQDVAEVFEVRVAAAHAAMAQLEGGDVGATYDLVVCVHAPTYAVRARVLDLEWGVSFVLMDAEVARLA